jgi:hypothetical protein
METKYRYRSASRKCPVCGKETIIKGKAEFGGGWLCFKKKGGCDARWSDGDEIIEKQETGKIENPDPADQWNTCLKMAKKRALIDACLTALGASTMFTQDIEDMETGNPPPAKDAGKKDAPPLQSAVDAADTGVTNRQAFDELKASATSAGPGVLAKFNKHVEEFLCNEKTLEELNEEDFGNLVKLINAKRKAK